MGQHETICWGFAPGPLPRVILIMKTTQRAVIRWFIAQVHWAVPSNLSYFMEGRCDGKRYRKYSSELAEMLKVKDREIRLKKIRNQDGRHAYTLDAKALPTFGFNHDVCLRDVVGKFLNSRGPAEVTFAKPADARILRYSIELDNGHMDDSQLEEKLRKHYLDSEGQVIFIMRHREFPHLEARRLKKVFDISARVFPTKPNKVLGACYHQYLEDGIFYNRRGQQR